MGRGRGHICNRIGAEKSNHQTNDVDLLEGGANNKTNSAEENPVLELLTNVRIITRHSAISIMRRKILFGSISLTMSEVTPVSSYLQQHWPRTVDNTLRSQQQLLADLNNFRGSKCPKGASSSQEEGTYKIQHKSPNARLMRATAAVLITTAVG